MIEIALYEPEIAPNTGNIMRLCANMGAKLHLIEPLGFDLEEKKLRRAGLDYRDLDNVVRHPDFAAFLAATKGKKLFACTTKTTGFHTDAKFDQDAVLLFGPETRGLPADVIESLPMEQRVRIPMIPSSRSLNLSNSVAVIAYEAWRQLGFNHAV
ncbi:tRNA (cytidine(34)-2'-O)-methyltransferase [Vibrio sp. SS-MA-C1-2]|uniref:tRNA (cytidine(34)-2'-O)-methyltransferase n=1 Tax=Vibrio sp. SS-MA-C1-2 TaxID=2908646 RepID=UPI001F2B171A|nr:tRNA (cytidine(34)-2'-O)-methyltransferase [Vibrio sp. SS-MA-C1-2]UJF19413.1 tRNA (cytidine(34)-2'-O)-methyltransferase [Vibrio sp. SS-MA-C1-2]